LHSLGRLPSASLGKQLFDTAVDSPGNLDTLRVLNSLGPRAFDDEAVQKMCALSRKLRKAPDTPARLACSLFRNSFANWAYGRGERIRTSDPLVPNQVLYQAEPLPELAVGRMFTS
jgi:hypothetical protein